ncbi:MAG: peptidylprolyl isomerase [Clostridia bacterium]|nr:peptidylprolyl isomerase [Clostridia bacterium]
MKRLFVLLIALLLCLPAVGCTEPEEPEVTYPVDPATSYTASLPRAEGRTLFVQFTMEGGATFVVELYPDKAPVTVENFQTLVEDGFYNGLTFHRVYKGFMIQGGDPDGNGTGGSPNKILGEFSFNPAFEGINDLSHSRGVISMARRSDSYNSASSQFFIMHANNPKLDGQYAAFGRVVAGMETVDTIANVEVERQSTGSEVTKPVERIVIESAYFVNFEG